MGRVYVQRESRLLVEWAAVYFADAELHFHARLGAITPQLDDPTLTEREIRALGIWRRYVDLLAADGRGVHLVEAKLRGAPGALEQLDLYARLLPLTPEYAHLKGRPTYRHLVWSVADPVIEGMARERGIEVHLYRPAWVDEYYGTLPKRAGAPTSASGLLPAEEVGEE
jgi:hypothetical protein